VLGEIVQVHLDEDKLAASGDRLDPAKVNLLLSYQMEYWDLGHGLGEWQKIK